MVDPISLPDMAGEYSFKVYGLPAPQGSKRHVGNGILVESSKRVRPWREAVKQAALDARVPAGGVLRATLTGAVSVDVLFYLPKPKSAPKRFYAAKRPDLDKLLRSTFDALGEAGVWGDDSQVVEVRAGKTYAEPGKALDVPGATITINAREEQATS